MTVGAVKVGDIAVALLSVTLGPAVWDHSRPVIVPSASVLAALVSVTAEPPATDWSGPAFAVGAWLAAPPVTDTVTDVTGLDPPAPVHSMVNVVDVASAPVDTDPEVPFVPVQPPEAVQVSAVVVDHVNIEVAPEATLVGLADKVTVGAAGPPGGFTAAVPLSSPPPQAASSAAVVEASIAARKMRGKDRPVRTRPMRPPRRHMCITSPELKLFC